MGTKENSLNIELLGVSTNNLKEIDVHVPLHKLTVVTGVSGSGKSSLVFDTLYAESYRRYVESLSSFARQYLKALPKPKITSVKNLPPAIAVRQSRSGATNRSTVGTLTEIHDSLRIIFAQVSKIYCSVCSKPVTKADPDKIARTAVSEFENQKVLVVSPLSSWENVEEKELKKLLVAQGFSRVWQNGQVLRIDELKVLKKSDHWIVVDRIQSTVAEQKRLAEASALALKLGRGEMGLVDESSRLHKFTKNLQCCGVTYIEPTLGLFSFNHPLGACQKCQGFGSMSIVDEKKVLPDLTESLATQGVVPWNFGEHVVCYEDATKSLTQLKMPASIKKKPFNEYSKSELDWLWNGDGKKFEGINGYFAWLETKRYKPHYRIHAARFRKYVICDQCSGDRLNEKSLACRIDGSNIAEVSNFEVEKLSSWIDRIEKQSQNESNGAEEALKETAMRLGYLRRMGLGYLSMNRSAPTLSGGELQRISMSRCLGSVLTDTLFCLDEPTAGLHARDSENLLGVIRDLQKLGNTVVVVEHEKTIIDDADYFVEIGPKAGHEGGYVVYQGAPHAKKNQKIVFEKKNKSLSEFIEITSASIHNLKNVNAKIPTKAVTAVCGVSGSGKTSLIKHTLYPLLQQFYAKQDDDQEVASVSKKNAKDFAKVGPANVIKKFSEVMLVSQVSLGRSSRSTIGTYLGLMDEIRKILAATDEALRQKLTAGSFSFNVAGGRCESCRGLGTIVEDLSFLGEMEIICPVCNGARFQEKVLNVRHKGKNLIDILNLTVSEARQFFFDKPPMVKNLDAVLDVGMGYVTLGQHTTSFSGGEAQRLKLVQIMKDAKNGKPSILIFDEPTTGLSDVDVLKLMEQFDLLASQGHTVIIVEHHLEVLRRADWLIELGPDASERGGEIVYQGTPDELKGNDRSVTERYLF